MQYNILVELLDTLIHSQSRAASAQRKNRPESSSPEKLKMRNPQKAGHSSGKKAAPEFIKKDNDADEDEDNYSDEEIANDPDDGDDGTNKLMQVNKNFGQQDDEDDDDDDQYLDEFEKV